MMMMINRQPVIKWCVTDASALWDSSRAVGRYRVRLRDSEQAHYPSMHRERGGGESAKHTPPADGQLGLHLRQTRKHPDCDSFYPTIVVINVLKTRKSHIYDC